MRNMIDRELAGQFAGSVSSHAISHNQQVTALAPIVHIASQQHTM
jgi:hypothetical protein